MNELNKLDQIVYEYNTFEGNIHKIGRPNHTKSHITNDDITQVMHQIQTINYFNFTHIS